jgi:DNA/RNA endonuclease G (NUC1)
VHCRATPDDYKEMNKSPFVRVLSRGHMAPAGNNKDSQAAMDATFLLESNIVPQVYR